MLSTTCGAKSFGLKKGVIARSLFWAGKGVFDLSNPTFVVVVIAIAVPYEAPAKLFKQAVLLFGKLFRRPNNHPYHLIASLAASQVGNSSAFQPKYLA